jgi:Fic family protein
MKASIFTARSPGRIVPITGTGTAQKRGGLPRAVTVKTVAFVPNPLPPAVDRNSFIGRLADEITAATTNLGRLDSALALLPNADSLVLRPFAIREATLSSKIENTHADAEEVASADTERPVARDEIREVANNAKALEYGLRSPLPLCNRLIREMHAILLDRVNAHQIEPGRFRTGQVYIGAGRGIDSATFVPPPAGPMLAECLHEFERFLNLPEPAPPGTRGKKTAARVPHVIEVAFAHYQFECIHPFFDGNGRVGRLLAVLSLAREGMISRPIVPISAYIDRHRNDYYRLLLRVSTHGDWDAWTRFMLKAISTQAFDAAARTHRLRDLRESFLVRAKSPRNAPTIARLVDLLFLRPAVTAKIVAAELSVSPTTAQSTIDRLQRAKILEETTRGGYDRLYVAREILQIVEMSEARLFETS